MPFRPNTTTTTTTTTTAISTEPASAEAQGDWRWQLRNAVSDVDELARRLPMEPSAIEGARRAAACGLPLRITPYVLQQCDPHDARCPIRLQHIPVVQECTHAAGELSDPLGEGRHEVVPGLIRRYPDRALLIATLQCAAHCRFCTRSRLVRTGAGRLPARALDKALGWLARHPEVREVIISGGDPLTLSTPQLAALVGRVRSVPSVERVRLATRAAAVMPMRIDLELVEALRPLHPIWFMVHFNHTKELTAEARRALAMLVDHGFPVMSQTVLLRGVNDDAQELAELLRALVNERVKPYYLLHGDVVAGSWHLRTTVERSIELYAQLQGRLSGLAVPRLVIDTPGGRGKVAVGPEAIVSRGGGGTTVRTYLGELVEIKDPPAGEKPIV
jgi:lysine 2,3-aminomutase